MGLSASGTKSIAQRLLLTDIAALMWKRTWCVYYGELCMNYVVNYVNLYTHTHTHVKGMLGYILKNVALFFSP